MRARCTGAVQGALSSVSASWPEAPSACFRVHAAAPARECGASSSRARACALSQLFYLDVAGHGSWCGPDVVCLCVKARTGRALGPRDGRHSVKLVLGITVRAVMADRGRKAFPISSAIVYQVRHLLSSAAANLAGRRFPDRQRRSELRPKHHSAMLSRAGACSGARPCLLPGNVASCPQSAGPQGPGARLSSHQR